MRYRLAKLGRLPVEQPKRVHEIVELHRRVPGRAAQGRDRLHRAGIRRPGGQDSALLRQCQIGIVDHIHWLREGLRRMQQRSQIKGVVAAITAGP
jgi:hypothetical protein